MNDSGRLAHAVTFGDVDGVRVSVPNQFDRRKRMIPTEIHSTNAWPIARKISSLAGNQFLSDGENAAAAERRNTLCACLALMRRIARDDLLFLLGGEMHD